MNLRLLTVTASAFVVGVGVFSLLSFDSGGPDANMLTVQGECDLSHSPCLAQDQLGHEVSISLSPRPVLLLEDVAVGVAVRGMDHLRVAQISVEGLNMYMGIQIIPLTITSSDNVSEQKLTGILQLPVCTSRTMEWRATLVLQTATKEYQAAYPFTTITP